MWAQEEGPLKADLAWPALTVLTKARAMPGGGVPSVPSEVVPRVLPCPGLEAGGPLIGSRNFMMSKPAR